MNGGGNGVGYGGGLWKVFGYGRWVLMPRRFGGM